MTWPKAIDKIMRLIIIFVALQYLFLALSYLYNRPSSALRTWVVEHRVPLVIDGPVDFSALDLPRLLAGKRVVMIGESDHNCRQYIHLKAELTRYLHENLGFDVVAFESFLFNMYRVDQLLDSVPADTALAQMGLVVWQHDEVADLFRYIQETRSTDHPMHVAGVDNRLICHTNQVDWGRFLARVFAPYDSVYADSIRQRYRVHAVTMDSAFAYPYSRRRHRDQIRSAGAFLDGVLRHAERLRREDARARRDSSLLVAAQVARSARYYCDALAADDPHNQIILRDMAMGQNAVFLAEQLYPGKKIVIWAHNLHIRKNLTVGHPLSTAPPYKIGYLADAFPAMGYYVQEHFGNQAYALGLYTRKGIWGRVTFRPRFAGSVERVVLDGLRDRAAFLDLSHLTDPVARQWWTDRQFCHDMLREKLRPALEFDGIIVVPAVERLKPRIPRHQHAYR